MSDYHQKRESKAAFAQGDLNIAPRVQFSVGLRYTDDNASYVGSTTDLNPWGVSIIPVALPSIPVFFDHDFAEENVSGRATLSWRPTDDTNLWASFGKGYKAGGFDGSTIFSTAEALPFRSEDVLAYEGGFKFAGRSGLFLNIDGFYYDFDDLQANTVAVVGGQATTTNVRTNVAKARIYGLDVAAGATIIRSGPHRLSGDFGFTLLDSKILAFSSANPDIAAVTIGNSLPASPKFTGNAQISYSYVADDWTLTGTVDARHKASEFKRLNNDPGSEVPSYTLVNARLDLKLTQSGIGLFAYVRNLTDKVYYIDYSAFGRLSGSPRIFGGGARIEF